MGVGAAGETDFEDETEVVEEEDGQLGDIMERAWAFLFIKQLHKKYTVIHSSSRCGSSRQGLVYSAGSKCSR